MKNGFYDRFSHSQLGITALTKKNEGKFQRSVDWLARAHLKPEHASLKASNAKKLTGDWFG